MSELLKRAWGGRPPAVKTITQPMPDTPCLPLSGSGTANQTIDRWLLGLRTDIERQDGDYFAYVIGGDGDVADTYILVDWEVLRDSAIYEAVVILYYRAIDELATLKKHFGQWAVDEYLAKQAAYAAIADVEVDS